MCVRTTDATSGAAVNLTDGRYHTYTIDCHTGNGTGQPGWVDFFVDGVYLVRGILLTTPTLRH